ncbi:hypothetical protein [Ketogulonicigenium vulgare]|uniref:hypothetical protein n=1 Tax=Ketogulonicigenium vulgare TaxID=92945 RepID=UPI0005C51B01|nr:hypothetical protein [Ketogulonicigenium vulgare]ANW33781.1 hypothetical protein KvSKV_07365 [Ketogulonicigenium vulgare]
MGSQLFVAGFHRGKAAGLPVADALAVFGLTEADESKGAYLLPCDVTLEMSTWIEDNCLTTLCIDRPTDNDRLYSEIFLLLSKGPYVAFVPDGPLATAQLEVKNHLPETMQEGFGPLVNVTSASALRSTLSDGQLRVQSVSS